MKEDKKKDDDLRIEVVFECGDCHRVLSSEQYDYTTKNDGKCPLCDKGGFYFSKEIKINEPNT